MPLECVKEKVIAFAFCLGDNIKSRIDSEEVGWNPCNDSRIAFSTNYNSRAFNEFLIMPANQTIRPKDRNISRSAISFF